MNGGDHTDLSISMPRLPPRRCGGDCRIGGRSTKRNESQQSVRPVGDNHYLTTGEMLNGVS